MPSKRRRARRDRENTGGPSPAWIGSAVLLGLVAVALVIVLIHAATSSSSGTPTAASPPGAPPGSTAQAGGAASPSGAPPATSAGAGQGRPAGCSTTGTDQTVPTSPPTGVTWSLASGVAVPSSAADGPKLRAPGGVGYCYSRTPLGAVLAASNLGMGTGPLQDILKSSLEHSAVPNEYAQAATDPTSGGGGAPPGDIQLAGFRIITYSPEQASIALSYRVAGNTDSYSQLTFAMQWYEGDWRDVPQPGPSSAVTNGTVPTLAGSVPWAGVS